MGGNAGTGGTSALNALTKAMEDLTKAINSNMGGGTNANNATLKNNFTQNALDNLTEKMDKFIERTKDGRKATQGMADTFENLFMRFRKFSNANPGKLMDFKEYVKTLKTTAKQLQADKLKDASQDIDKSLSTMWRRLNDGRKITQGSADSFENLLNTLEKLGVASQTTINQRQRELVLIKNKVYQDRLNVKAAQDEVKANKAKRKATKEAAVTDRRETLIDSLTTGIERFNAAAVPSQKAIYALQDKLKRLGKLDTSGKLTGPIQNQIATIQKKRDAYVAKLSQDAKDKEFNEAEKTYNKLSKQTSDYYSELKTSSNITPAMTKKFKKLTEGLIEAAGEFNRASTLSGKKRFKDIAGTQTNLNTLVDLVKTRDTNNKTKKEAEASTKALEAQAEKLFAFKKQMDMLGPAFTIGVKQAAKMLDEIRTYQSKIAGTRAGIKGKGTELNPVAEMLEKRIEQAKGATEKKDTPIKQSSSIMGMIGKSITNSLTGALTGGISGIVMNLVGTLLSPFTSLISAIMNTVGVLIKWFLVVSGILGWAKNLELALSAFAAKVEFSSDRVLSLDTAVQRVSTGIVKSVNELGSSVVSAVDNALMNPLTGFVDIVNKISKFVGLVNPGLMEQYNRVLDNLMALIGSALQPVVIEITNLMYEFGTQLKPMIEMLGGYFAKALRALAMALIPLIPQIIMGLTQLAGALIGYVAEMGVKIAEGGLNPDRDKRIKDEENRRNEEQGLNKTTWFGSEELTEQRVKARELNKKLAIQTVDREIKQQNEAAGMAKPSDFMDMAVAKNARFTGGVEMGKSSIQKAFEASSSYGIQGKSEDQTLKEAQLNFYTNPSEWVKKAMAVLGAPPQVGGPSGGSADGSHLNPLQKFELMRRLVGAGTGSVKSTVSFLTLGVF